MGRSILLTGATGALGPHLLQELLSGEAFERIFVLMRPGAHRSDLNARLLDTLRRVVQGTSQPWPHRPERRLVPVAGDICRDSLALDPELARRVMSEVDLVIHAAANTRFTAPERVLHEINVQGTSRVLQLASRCPRLQQVLVVSTTCVAGTRTGPIAERLDNEPPGFVNAYERTKWLAERRALATHLPVRIARLSTCIGDSRTGYVHRLGAVHRALQWFVRGLIPMVPAADGARVDLIPTDLAARWLARAATRPVERIDVAQIAAGQGAIPLEEFMAFVVQRLRSSERGWNSGQMDAPVVVDAETFGLFERTAVHSGDPLFRRVLESVQSFLPALLHPKVYLTSRAAAGWGEPLPLGNWQVTLGRVMEVVLARRRRTHRDPEVACV